MGCCARGYRCSYTGEVTDRRGIVVRLAAQRRASYCPRAADRELHADQDGHRRGQRVKGGGLALLGVVIAVIGLLV